MDNGPEHTRDYLRPPHDAFWTWADGGDTACWADGKTIAFRAELYHILERHVQRGLPPLGTVMLLLAALRDGYQQSTQMQDVLTRIIRSFDDAAAHLELLEDVHCQLARVARFDAALKGSLLARIELIDMVLAECRERTSPQAAAAILNCLQSPLPESISDAVPLPLVTQWWHLGPTTLARDLRHLRDGLPKVEEPALRLRLRTGLEAEVQAPSDDLAPVEKIRALVGDLQDDEQLGSLARLAHDLMAAVTLPRKVSQPDELPLGGVFRYHQPRPA